MALRRFSIAHCIGFFVCHCLTRFLASGESFTAITHFKGLLDKEKLLAVQLQAYLKAEESRLRFIHRFAEQVAQSETHSDQSVEERLGHPTNAFRLVRRFTSGWRNVEAVMTSPLRQSKELLDSINSYIPMFPTEEDLKGATVAVRRLQDVYKVNTSSMSRGLAGTQGEHLTIDDCYLLGQSAYNDDDWRSTKRWMSEVLRRLDQGEFCPTEIKRFAVLDHLAFAEYKIGNLRQAFRLTKKLLSIDPKHGRLLSNEKIFQAELYEAIKAEIKQKAELLQRNKTKEPEWHQYRKQLNDEDFQYWRDFYRYKHLCRSPIKPRRSQEQHLKCFLSNEKRNPQLILRPVKVEVASLHPTIILYRDIISEVEMALLKELANPILNRATAYNRNSGKYEPATYRVSKSAWISEDMDSTGVVERVDRRIEAITGLSMTTAEQLQVVNYGIGGHYEPHFDYAHTREAGPMNVDGERIATFLIYMSDVSAGGCTVFPRLPARIEPSKGDASFWYNLLPSGDGDQNTRHAGCPVLSGSKWVCNKWIHERGQEFRKPCKKNRSDKWDIHIPPKHL